MVVWWTCGGLIAAGLVILVASVLAALSSLRRFETAARVLRVRARDVGALEMGLAVTQTRAEALREPLTEMAHRSATLRERRTGEDEISRHGR